MSGFDPLVKSRVRSQLVVIVPVLHVHRVYGQHRETFLKRDAIRKSEQVLPDFDVWVEALRDSDRPTGVTEQLQRTLEWTDFTH